MKYVLVTGTSSGIGRATALHLDQQGFTVLAGLRDLGQAAELTDESEGRIEPVELDITDAASIDSALAQITRSVGVHGLAGVVNNAGQGIPGPLELVALEDLRAQLEVNVVGHVAVTQAVLPLIRRGGGRIVFVGSIGGKFAFQFAGPYHASKFAIEGLADSWRQELQPDGIPVSIIEPGPMSSGIWTGAEAKLDALMEATDGGGRYRERLLGFRDTLRSADDEASDPQQVAEVIVRALSESRPASRYAVGLSARLGYRVKPFIPDRVYDVVARRLTI